MSTFKVPVTPILSVEKHPNADRLDVVKIYDWSVVTQKDKYKVGDLIVYVPVNSILSQELEAELFPPDSKIRLNKRRIRSIKIRGVVSQGMIINPEDIKLPPSLCKEEMDLASALNIIKYEPPASEIPNAMQAKKIKKTNPNFTKYTDIENYKYYDRLFQDNENVYISEKMHGTSFRAGWFPNTPNTLWKKLLNLFGLLPKWEFCWGSRNVQIQNKLYHRGYYDTDVYTKMVKQYGLDKILPKGYAIYGEIVGHGLQKGYTYGLGENHHELLVYDIKHNDVYLDYHDFRLMHQKIAAQSIFATGRMLKTVPNLYVGPYDKSLIEKYRDGDSTMGGQKIREGIVIKPVIEQSCSIGRKVLKCISEAYYLKQDEVEGTEFH